MSSFNPITSAGQALSTVAATGEIVLNETPIVGALVFFPILTRGGTAYKWSEDGLFSIPMNFMMTGLASAAAGAGFQAAQYGFKKWTHVGYDITPADIGNTAVNIAITHGAVGALVGLFR